MNDWSIGDRVTLTTATDHPEDPVGEVVMKTADGGIVALFPQAGAEVHRPEDLAPAPEPPV
ncbi:hypothetical protein OTB20_17180 [Streptomyces sp. H27-H1]|uniref:hypothetical protein n=1 Tax=Streptomyces sp. H27-H1 TaxID=2996461 RepID=UPI00227071BE|nr:hypothetical protein [Streptomyces sp. H27-H1]MCY0927914.1 hypothetical protein [Streptomyces sp. H27-H1]